MGKHIYLICNAHLDPVWQWEWEEGAAEVLSTFRVAAELCGQYDTFIFCHNEAILYEWTEQYDPALFEQIRELVKRGKWHIMGGWYLQPDCNLPCGELMLRQIEYGRTYFAEKFGVAPTVAVNVDPFGHSRGLVQLLSKTGYTGYLFMRPGNADQYIRLPADEFVWEGYDGSRVTAVRLADSYNSRRGQAAEKVKAFLDACDENGACICLWGIGDHGGGPSKKDLDDLDVLMRQTAQTGDRISHETPEAYFEMLRKKNWLPSFQNSLNPWGVGCYTSQRRVKKKYRQAENEYLLTEKMTAHAALASGRQWPSEALKTAQKDILFAQFHDMLPGSAIEPAERTTVQLLDHALEELSRIKMQAFMTLCAGQKPPKGNHIPILAYNPHPYSISGDFLCEFMLWDQCPDTPYFSAAVVDEAGTELPAQAEQPYSCMPFEWRKRVVFHAELPPMQMSRFDCILTAQNTIPRRTAQKTDGCYIVQTEAGIRIAIGEETGLVEQYRKNDKEYLAPGAFALEVYADSYDPWGMLRTAYTEKVGVFRLATPAETKEICCTEQALAPVHVIESGPVRTVVESVFVYGRSYAVMRYFISQQGELQLQLRVSWQEKQKMLRMSVPAAFDAQACIAEQMLGQEPWRGGMEENVQQRWTALCSGQDALLIVNDGVYGGAFDEKTGTLKLSLLHTPCYCAHPGADTSKTPVPQDRYTPHMDLGEQEYCFSVSAGAQDAVLMQASRKAQAFNQQPVLLSCSCASESEKPETMLRLAKSEGVECTAIRADKTGGWRFYLFNSIPRTQNVQASFAGAHADITLQAFEYAAFFCDGATITRTELLDCAENINR